MTSKDSMHMHLHPFSKPHSQERSAPAEDSSVTALPSQKHVPSCDQQQKRVALGALHRLSASSSTWRLSPRSEHPQHAMAPEDLTPAKGHQTPEIDGRCGKAGGIPTNTQFKLRNK